MPCDSDKRNGNELFAIARGRYGYTETIGNNSSVKTVLK